MKIKSFLLLMTVLCLLATPRIATARVADCLSQGNYSGPTQ